MTASPEYRQNTEQDPFPFTTLREEMEAAGIDDEMITNVIGTHQDDIQGARNVFNLLSETQAIVSGVTANKAETGIDREPIASKVRDGLGQVALEDPFRKIQGDLFDDTQAPVNKPAAAPGYKFSPPPQQSTEGQDLSPAGIKAWVEANKNR